MMVKNIALSRGKWVEWIVAISVAYMISFSLLASLLKLVLPSSESIFILSRNIFLLILLYYQNKHYGLKIKDKQFLFFFIVYSLYVYVYLFVSPVYKIDYLLRVPQTSFNFLIGTLQIMTYMLCADTIMSNFKVSKFIIVGIFFSILPALFFIQYVGAEVLQMYGVDKDNDEFSILALGYCNVPLLVFCVVFFFRILQDKYISGIMASIVIIVVAYILMTGGERGPIIWSVVNLVICFFISTKHKTKYLMIVVLTLFLIIANIDSIIGGIGHVSSHAAEKVESTLKEGDTNGRFDVNNPEGSTYLIGLNQFFQSPLWGSYFRLVTEHRSFKGAYPHNVFIEILMTMGLLGFIPFIAFLVKSWKKINKVLKKGNCTDSKFACLILFLSTFLQLQTTWSIVLNLSFWPFFYMMCVFDMPIKEKTSIGHIYANKTK